MHAEPWRLGCVRTARRARDGGACAAGLPGVPPPGLVAAARVECGSDEQGPRHRAAGVQRPAGPARARRRLSVRPEHGRWRAARAAEQGCPTDHSWLDTSLQHHATGCTTVTRSPDHLGLVRSLGSARGDKLGSSWAAAAAVLLSRTELHSVLAMLTQQLSYTQEHGARLQLSCCGVNAPTTGHGQHACMRGLMTTLAPCLALEARFYMG